MQLGRRVCRDCLDVWEAANLHVERGFNYCACRGAVIIVPLARFHRILASQTRKGYPLLLYPVFKAVQAPHARDGHRPCQELANRRERPVVLQSSESTPSVSFTPDISRRARDPSSTERSAAQNGLPCAIDRRASHVCIASHRHPRRPNTETTRNSIPLSKVQPGGGRQSVLLIIGRGNKRGRESARRQAGQTRNRRGKARRLRIEPKYDEGDPLPSH